MKNILFCLFFTALGMALPLNIIEATHVLEDQNTLVQNLKPATIRVLLKKNIEGALIEVKGPYQVCDPQNGKILSNGPLGKRFFLYPHKEGISWGESFLGVFQIRVVPTHSKTTISVDGIQYKGCLEVYNINDRIAVVNEVDVENYLSSYLNATLNKKLPDTVMDAISIIGRTHAYYQVLHNKYSFWHVDASEVNYRGHSLTHLNSFIDKAVERTRYLVMTYDKAPFATTWTENCAGATTTYSTILRKQLKGPGGIESPFAKQSRDKTAWSFSVERNELANIAKTNRVTGLELYVDKASNKAYALRIQDGSHHKEIDFSVLQKGLGAERLLSSDFTVAIQGNHVVFQGFGEGLGAGLCLYSACRMAEKGEDMPEILATFFPDTKLEYMRSYTDPDLATNLNSILPAKNIKH